MKFSTANETLPLVPEDQNSTMSNEATVSVVTFLFRGILTVFLAIIIISCVFDTAFVVEPGTIGLIVTLGNVVAVQNGVHFKIPLVSKVIMFTAKTQKLEESNNTPTKEGLSVQLDTAM